LELVEQELPENYRIKHDLPEGSTYGDAIAVIMMKNALEGNPSAVREIREAIEGKTGPRQEEIGEVTKIKEKFEEPIPPRDKRDVS
jgi:hypothetical protein